VTDGVIALCENVVAVVDSEIVVVGTAEAVTDLAGEAVDVTVGAGDRVDVAVAVHVCDKVAVDVENDADCRSTARALSGSTATTMKSAASAAGEYVGMFG
jgi:hypothetical protein